MLRLLQALTFAAPVTVGVLHGQSSAPKYKVASIRPSKDCGASRDQGTTKSGPEAARLGPGRLSICLPLSILIAEAYGRYPTGKAPTGALDVGPIEGGPAWVRSEPYQVNATAEGDPPLPMMLGPMLQALLEDRFKLVVRRESNEEAVYLLTVAKGGAKLQQSKDGSCTPIDKGPPALGQQLCGMPRSGREGRNGTLEWTGLSMDAFTKIWLKNFLGRPVVDQTGLVGKFSFRLAFAPDDSTPGAMPATPLAIPLEPGGTSIFTALQEQLGLRLESGKAPRETLVIDNVERPSEN